jgi:phosphoglycolate phosphatase
VKTRLILFDIDGTLLSGGPAKEAFRSALVEVFGTPGPIQKWDFSGKTDPQIARELLQEESRSNAEIDQGFPLLWTGYLRRLEALLPAQPTEPLPGVPALLDALTREAGVALGLVTGNLERGAELKLASAGLGPFPLGGFGSDHEERNHLPAVALDRAQAHWGRRFHPDEVVVVGDTPRDVACGQAHRLRTLAVATGRFPASVLRDAGADVTLDDFSDPEAVCRILLG